jgi:trans-aconitate methyltransferase
MTNDLFDLSDQYDEMLNAGLRLSGEDKHYFIGGRVNDLRCHLPDNVSPRRILDFGCGIGDATRYLAKAFPHATVVGADTAVRAIEHARRKHGSDRVCFLPLDALTSQEQFDLCYVNGVFHHIKITDRLPAVSLIRSMLNPGGFIALFENNPWNMGTRLVMRRIQFDADAEMLTMSECKKLIIDAGFRTILAARFLFYFPRVLAFMRPLETYLSKLPLGAQYYVLARCN